MGVVLDVVEEVVEEVVEDELLLEEDDVGSVEVVDEVVDDDVVVLDFEQSSSESLVTVSAPSRRLPLSEASTLPGSPTTIDLSRSVAEAVASQSPAATAESTSLRAALMEFDCELLSSPLEAELPHPESGIDATTITASSRGVRIREVTLGKMLDAKAESIRH